MADRFQEANVVGALVLEENAANPWTPAGGKGALYLKNDGTLWFVDEAGDELQLAAGGVFQDVYENDLTAEASQDFKALGGDGTYTLDDGTDWDVANSANAGTFRLLNGTGLQIIHGAAATNINNAQEDSPMFRADLSELFAALTPTDEWRVLFFYSYANLDATYEYAYMGYRSEDSYNATKNTAIVLHGRGATGVDQISFKITAASSSDSVLVPSAGGRPNTDRVMIVTGTNSMITVALHSGITYAAAWPAMTAWQRLFGGMWIVDNKSVDDAGPTHQVCCGVIDTSAGDVDATIVVERILLQRRVG